MLPTKLIIIYEENNDIFSELLFNSLAQTTINTLDLQHMIEHILRYRGSMRGTFLFYRCVNTQENTSISLLNSRDCVVI